jgi:copper oxidase (laccase) domain-containing protein
MARVWCTNRSGFHPASAPLEFLGSRRPIGFSEPPYDRLNLGLKVGDTKESVLSNRNVVREAIGLKEILYMDQVHSARMVRLNSVPKPDQQSAEISLDGERCDGIFLFEPDQSIDQAVRANIGLAVQVADCVPLIIVAENLMAAVHIGRDGLLAGMTESALDAISAHVALTSLRAFIGPSICGDCYPNRLEVFHAVSSKYPTTVWSEQDRKLDVAAGVISILEGRGITWSWFGESRECVSCDDSFFSYRRSNRSGSGNTGRQAMIVAW